VLAARSLSALAGCAIRTLRATLRLERLHQDRYESLQARGVPILFALWHGRMFLSILEHRGQDIATMASQSKDGEIIARWLTRNGYVVTRGSTTRGGGQALRELVRHMRRAHHAALTVDGPKGPPRAVQQGVVQLAKLTGAWILPITSSCSHPRFLSSWDRYLLPLPFSRAIVAYGEPFPISKDLPDAAAASLIAEALDAATAEADASAGITPPEVWSAPRHPAA
jgi:lysophospholipid acyltransferase (LPLAT)-like uncharacterized protein